jgi:hypothetical protein
MDKIVEFLKKIGVIQSGASTWQGDADNRPVDFGESVSDQPVEDLGQTDSIDTSEPNED